MAAMPTLVPWQGADAPSEAAVEEAFRREGLAPRWWGNAPGYVYGVHSHPYHKVLYCVRGSIRFTVEPAGPSFHLRPGDRLELPAGTPHSAVVGPEGVTCAEAARG
jgi:quercetin dioxygenase-like cupin family protein